MPGAALRLPWDPALRGQTFCAQGGALDPSGDALGIAAFSSGVAVRLGG